MVKKSIVVDSSVIVKFITSANEELIIEANLLLADCKDEKIDLYAPELAKYEIGNAILKKKFTLPLAKASLETLYALPVEFITQSEEQAKNTIEIAQSVKITFYDASFISLAKELDAILVTDNPKHQKKFEGVKVIPLSKYR